MLSSSHFFDRLPVELLHNLFEYFATHEILLTFTDLNEHVNVTLRSYRNYKLVFKSIREAQLDLIYRYIEPEQIVSLTLCSDKDAGSSQLQLFFSQFHIEQFTHLQSLTLIKMEPEILQFIIPHLSKLHSLHSFSFNYISIRYIWMDEFSHLASLLTNNYAPIASHLKSLHLNSEKTALRTLYSHLYSLKHNNCPLNALRAIFQHVPQLRSLRISFDISRWNPQVILPSNRLVSLDLEITSK